jgi:hypothetical protein
MALNAQHPCGALVPSVLPYLEIPNGPMAAEQHAAQEEHGEGLADALRGL